LEEAEPDAGARLPGVRSADLELRHRESVLMNPLLFLAAAILITTGVIVYFTLRQPK